MTNHHCPAVVRRRRRSPKTGLLLLPLLLVLLGCSCPTLASSSSLLEFLPTGDIADTQCNQEDLERANDSQLHAILQELQQTTFFSQFIVDLEHHCPLDAVSPSQPEEEEDEFECASSGMEELGMDEEDEPLCTVQGGDDADASNPFHSSPFGKDDPFESSVLHTLKDQGFSSNTQRETFEWNDQTDMIVQDETDTPPCDDDLPDTFWMDMCSSIQTGDGTKLVNLGLNPERNTGYNGTHIWKAIYEENCITTSDSCLEERVLYRLLSGLHTSTTLSIAKNYYPPSKRKGRETWEANPKYFMEKLGQHPEYIRNMHFSYVVLLRAIRKANDYLYDYDFHSSNSVDDHAAQVLVRRLLDTTILRSCSGVFSAFDESLMFQQQDAKLQENFKDVFHNISSILDCVQCQQCKLHGKMGMTGYGAALKILFVKPELLDLERNEVVALVNTAARLSESLVEVRELSSLYWEQEQSSQVDDGKAKRAPSSTPSANLSTQDYDSLDILDITIAAISSLGKQDQITLEREQDLVQLALSRHPELLILGKHYGDDLDRFSAMISSIGSSSADSQPDAIIVGSGLAGLAAALNILDRGGSIVMLEKEHLLGGNSNKASSGINGCCPQNDTYGDSLEAFRNDTIRSAGEVADLDLISTLVGNSEKAVIWLKERANVDLSLLAQLGGHSYKRTHRPSNGMAGAEIIYHLQKELRLFEKTGKATIIVDTRVTSLITEDDRVIGVKVASTLDGTERQVLGDNVVLATGGFASDRSEGSYLDQNRPELMNFPATAGSFSTGDGISLATDLGAGIRDMDKVQLHPTGWVDPTDPKNPTKVLAAELMRGIGGILVSPTGERFCNELGTRAYVTDKMLQFNTEYNNTGKWDEVSEIPVFHLILSSAAALDGEKHVGLYTHKGLLKKLDGIDALSAHMGVPTSTLTATIRQYQSDAEKGTDAWGKNSFRGLPAQDLSVETFYVGQVTPVLHYCMGGILIDSDGHVMKEDGTAIAGLRAAGEVTGGVHGNNRLGGNSLLECTIFGTIVGTQIPVKPSGQQFALPKAISQKLRSQKVESTKELPKISLDELAKHDTQEDLWVAIHGTVYDFSDFADEHPGGFQSVFELAGKDGTDAFSAVHNQGMLDDFEEDKMGFLVV